MRDRKVVDAARSSRRRIGLVLGAAGFVLLFGPAVVLLYAPATLTVLLLGAMGVGIVLLIAAFMSLPRRR